MPLLIPASLDEAPAHAASAGARRRLLRRADASPWWLPSTAMSPKTLRRSSRSTTSRSTSRWTSRKPCVTARRWSMRTRPTISRRISSRSAAIRMTPSPRPSTSPRSASRSIARRRRRWNAGRSRRAGIQVSEELTVWDGTQAPISLRGGLSSILKLDEDKVRVIAPNVGGGFGQKIMMFYPDELLVPMAAMQLGRPVKYIEDRRENFIGSSQERTQIHYDRACSEENRRGHRAARQLPARHRRVHSLRHCGRAGGVDLDRRAVPHPQHLGRVQGGLYADGSGDPVPRLRAARTPVSRSSAPWTSSRRNWASTVSRYAGAISLARMNSPIRARVCCLPMASGSRSTAASTTRRST